MMRFIAAALLLLAFGGVVLAQTTPSGDQQRRLIEQKMRLVEMLVNSPAAKKAASEGDAGAPKLVKRGQVLLREARTALGENRLDDAAAALDQALKSASSASRRLSSKGGLSDSAQQKQLADMTEQVRTYRAAVVEVAKKPDFAADANEVLQRVDALSAASDKFAAAGRIGDANKRMASAYKVVVEELSRLRAGEEVVLALNFETPADEYAYEQKRFSSNQVIIDMMVGDGRADGARRRLVERFLGEGRRAKTEAEAQADGGKYAAAVVLMEDANK